MGSFSWLFADTNNTKMPISVFFASERKQGATNSAS